MDALRAASKRAGFRRMVLASAIEDFESACLTGTRLEVDAAQNVVVRAVDDLCWKLRDQANEILKLWGIDPITRPA